MWSFQSTSASLPTLTATTTSSNCCASLMPRCSSAAFLQVLAANSRRVSAHEARAALVIAELGLQPDAQHDLDWELVLADQLEGERGVLARVVEADQIEIVRDENLEVFENLIGARVHGAVAAIRMLAFPKPRVRDGHDFSRHQSVWRLPTEVRRDRRMNLVGREEHPATVIASGKSSVVSSNPLGRSARSSFENEQSASNSGCRILRKDQENLREVPLGENDQPLPGFRVSRARSSRTERPRAARAQPEPRAPFLR